jgi:cytochrome c oxidase subunit IV
MMEETFVKVEELADNLKEYAEIRVEEAKLKIAERSSGLIANLMAGLLVRVGVVLAIMFAGLAVAVFLGEWWGRMSLGFLALSVIYLIVAWIVWTLRERFIRIPMMNSIMKHLTKKNEEDDTE